MHRFKRHLLNRLLLGSIIIWGMSLFGQSAAAQGIDLGSWNLINVRYTYDDDISVFAEAQLRSLAFYTTFHYYEVKGGINYRLLPEVILTVAAGNYDTYSEGGNFASPKVSDEVRLWPQLLLLQRLGTIRVEQRYRMELRFTQLGYRNRFRYRLGVSLPLLRGKGEQDILSTFIGNELFFTNREPYFERSRFSTALITRITPELSLHIGYVFQFDYRIFDESGRDFLLIGLYYDL